MSKLYVRRKLSSAQLAISLAKILFLAFSFCIALQANVQAQDTTKPKVVFKGTNALLPGLIGPNSSQRSYQVPSLNGVQFKSILTVGDGVGSYRLVGIPDGTGAYDNGDGTFTVLINHEIPNSLGVPRAHGGIGAFVSKWVVRKSDLAVLSGSDLMQQIYLWNPATSSFVLTPNYILGRFCSADLPEVSAFYNSVSGKGTTARIFMNGEETGTEGKGMGHVVTGADAGKSYELAYTGKFSWENSLAHYYQSDKTIVVGTDDGTGGQVYVYIGTKQTSGNEVEKAGLNNGRLYGIKVTGFAAETNTSIPAPGTRFELFDQGDVSAKTGTVLNNESIAAGVTSFLRPEDGFWDPSNPRDFYFVTTNAIGANTRLWRVRFDNIDNPETGGVIDAVIDGTEKGQQMFDNMTVDKFGHIIIQEDVGNNNRLGRVWQYDIATDSLFEIATHDSAFFAPGGSQFLTRDEEASGVTDLESILGKGYFLSVDQAHYGIAGELVEGGQVQVFFNPYVFGTPSNDTITVNADSCAAPVTLGTPLAIDNVGVTSLTNNAPAIFPIGATEVTWTATDAAGNVGTAVQVVIVQDSTPPVVVVSPSTVFSATNDGCGAQVALGKPTVVDNCTIASLTSDAPLVFPVGTTVVTWTAIDSSGNIGTATQTVTVSDTLDPVVYLNSKKILAGITGVSSSQSPYINPSKPGVQFKSILTVGDSAENNNYRLVGIPDGLGAFDNGDSTFTLLVNHEIPNSLGVPRAHGGIGAFVSKWVINKSNLRVVTGSDLIQQTYLYDTTTESFVLAPNTVFGRFCSADLPNFYAFYNPKTGKGTGERIFMNGEETGNEGRGFGHVVTGAEAGKTYELPYTGKFSWENSVARPYASDKTVVVGLDDATPGQVYVYIGDKQHEGNTVEKAGLNEGNLYGVKVTGYPLESNGALPAPGTRFSLYNLGDVSKKSGAVLNAESNAAEVTNFLRPEDGSWDPENINDFYFVTTNAFNSPTRLWRLRFDNADSIENGGVIEAVLDGTEKGQQMFDNITVDGKGHVLITEDVGNNNRLGVVWQYDIATDSLIDIGVHDSTRFLPGGTQFLTRDEEASGIIDAANILGEGWYLVDVQAHYGIPGELVEGGQLLAFFNPYSFAPGTASDTVKVFTNDTTATANLGIPAVSDNCTVTSLTNNAPSSYSIGNTPVIWTATDASGNTGTATQIVSVKTNTLPTVSIWYPVSGAIFQNINPIEVRALASDVDGSVVKVEFFADGFLVGGDSTAPYSISVSNAPAGTFVLTAVATDNLGATRTSAPVTITVYAPCVDAGTITANGWFNVTAFDQNSINNTINNVPPDVTATLNRLEYATVGTNYIGQIKGYVCPPVSGKYTFIISADDKAELYLSTTGNPANKRRIAFTGTTPYRGWSSNNTQRSVQIDLTQGNKYYIEIVHAQQVGEDHVSVGWILPNGQFIAPISGTNIAPLEAPAAPANVAAPQGRDFQEVMRERQSALVTKLTVTANPNPSTSYFQVLVKSNSNDPVSIRLVDVLGRTVENRSQIAPNNNIRVGQNAGTGVYFLEVIQGRQSQRLKLVKGK